MRKTVAVGITIFVVISGIVSPVSALAVANGSTSADRTGGTTGTNETETASSGSAALEIYPDGQTPLVRGETYTVAITPNRTVSTPTITIYERGNEDVEFVSAGASHYSIQPSTVETGDTKLVASTDENVYAGQTVFVRIRVSDSAATDQNFELAATLESNGKVVYTASETYDVVADDPARTLDSLAAQARARARLAESKAKMYDRLNRSDEFERTLVVGTLDGLVTVSNAYVEKQVTSVVPGLGTTGTIYDIASHDLGGASLADPVAEIIDSMIPPGGYATGMRRALVFDGGHTGQRLDDLAALYRDEARAWNRGNRQAALDAIRAQNDLLIDDNGAANEDTEPVHLKEAAHDQWDQAQAITNDTVRNLLTDYFAGIEAFATDERARITDTLRPAAKQVGPSLSTGTNRTAIATRVGGLAVGESTTVTITVRNAQGLANDTFLSVSHTRNLNVTAVTRVDRGSSVTVARYGPGATLNTATGGTTTAQYPLVDIHDTGLFGPGSNATYELVIERTGDGAATIWYRTAMRHLASPDGPYRRAPANGTTGVTDQQGFTVYRVESGDDGGSNGAPSVDAGSNRTVTEGTTVSLSATGSDPDGDPLTYAWTQTGGPTASLNASGSDVTFTALSVNATRTVTLTVTVRDGNGATATDSVTVTVEPVAERDAPNAALTVTPTDPAVGELVTLDASNSTDSDGIQVFRWDFDGDGTVDAETADPVAFDSYGEAGPYNATVTVVDRDGATATVSRKIIVDDQSGGPSGSDTVVETFEDATLDDWIDVEAASITTRTVFNGSTAAVITDRNEEMFRQYGHYTGNRIYRNGSASTPSTLSAAVRISDGAVNDLRVNWRNDTGAGIVGINLNNYDSNVRINGQSVSTLSTYTWYHVELTDIDWRNNTVGTVRIDGQRVGTDVAFKNPAESVTNVSVSINDGGTGSQGWVDDVTVPGTGTNGSGDGEDSEGPASVPFTERFATDIDGWTVGYSEDANNGTATWSDAHGGSAKLHVSGAPGEVRLSRAVRNLSAGDRITVTYAPERFGYVESGLTLRLVTPSGETIGLDAENDHDGVREQNGTMIGTVPRDLPNGTLIQLRLRIWPGETTVYVQNVTVTDGETHTQPTATFTSTPANPETGESVAFDATNSSTPAASITTYAWDFDGDGRTDATGATSNHTFLSPGTYTVTLTVTDSAGGTATASRLITVTAPSPPEPPETIGVSTGDPHIVTFDGLAYDFQAAGEFVLVDEAGGPFEVQARQVPVDGRDVTVNAAVATRLDGHEVTIDARATELVSVDGQPITVNQTHPATVGNGSVFYDSSSSVYTVVYPGSNDQLDDGDAQLVADVIGDRIDVTVRIDPADHGPLSGLFGSADGNRGNDLALANGTALGRPPSFDVLYGAFRSDWRVTNATTLFSYADGNGPGTYYRPSVPAEPTTLDDFPDAEVEDAKALARDAGLSPGTVNFRNAVLDYLLTNDTSYFDSAQQAPETPDQNRTTPDVNGTTPGGAVGTNSTVETFEDATLADWTDVEAASITTRTAFARSNAVVITDRNEELFRQNGHYTGNRIVKNGTASAPSTLSAAVRIDDGIYNDLRVRWRNATGAVIVGINLDVYNSDMYVDGERVFGISPYTWYRVELAGIDWQNDTVGTVRVDGQSVATDVAFRNPATSVTNVSLSVNDAGIGSKVWMDNVTVPDGNRTSPTPDPEPDPDSPNASRSLSTTEVSPGETVTVRLRATATDSTVSFTEAFAPGVGAASVTDVTVDGTSLSPVVATANADGVVVTLDGLSPGAVVEVRYEIQIDSDANPGTTVAISGNVSAISTHSLGTDQVAVVNSTFDGAAADYNKDGDAKISIAELAAAAGDFASDDLGIGGLAQVAAAFARSNG